MWQSFTAIGRGTAEGTWRKKKKHHEHFISPPVTTYVRPNKGLKFIYSAVVSQIQIRLQKIIMAIAFINIKHCP